MKACIIQPGYSVDHSLSDQYFAWEMAALDRCDPSMDIIVMPEACDVPCLAKTQEMFWASVNKYNARLLAKASETAARCGAMVFVNAIHMTATGPRNTTFAFDTRGVDVGHYYKQHLTPSETDVRELDSGYTYEFSEPMVLEIDGVRYGFLVCYDFYFFEMFANMARLNLDVVIGCSHQRSDTHRALELFTANLAYNCNAYVLRASVSMGEDSPLGGGSMAVAPDGTVLLNMGSRVGMACVEFDPHRKYAKPAGFGNPEGPHHAYIEAGRRPWKYRPGGSAIVRHDAIMPHPRVCAHRGFSTVAPENSMPAFGAAVALGAEEIEFDLWPTADGEIVSIHDPTLDRVSDGSGHVWAFAYDALLKLDFGAKADERFRGMRIATFEEILKKFACHVIMNIHVKTRDNTSAYDEDALRKIVRLIKRYDCEKHCYFMSGNDTLLKQMGEIAPNIARCVGGGDAPYAMVERAIALGCQKVQLFKPYFDQAMIDRAHRHGIACNVFWSDDPEETRRFLDMGIDTILSNDYLSIARTVNEWKAARG